MSEPEWRTSSYSGKEGECVEVKDVPGAVLVRDSKAPEAGVLSSSGESWTALLRQLGRL